MQWVSCFENVTAVLFLVALSGYNSTLVEDKDSVRPSSPLSVLVLILSQNQMHEALMLFDSICNSQWFLKTNMVRPLLLFLTHADHLRRSSS